MRPRVDVVATGIDGTSPVPRRAAIVGGAGPRAKVGTGRSFGVGGVKGFLVFGFAVLSGFFSVGSAAVVSGFVFLDGFFAVGSAGVVQTGL